MLRLLRNGHDLFYMMRNSEYSEGQNTGGKQTADVLYNHSALGWAGGCPELYFSNGITHVLLNFNQGEPEERIKWVGNLLCQERCTFAFIVPTYIDKIMSSPELWEYADFWFCSVLLAGQPVYKRHIQGAIGKITDAICVIYGGTEIGLVACNFVTNPDEYEDCNNGKPLENTEVKIVDDTLTEVGKGEIGEVCVRSCRVLTHYLSNDETTQNSLLPVGWFQTGDVGHLNGHGQLFIVCRSSFSIIRGPYIIYPGWLETQISHHPEVQQVMVVPVPDPVMHQELCACVVTRTGATVTLEDLHDFCKEMFLTKEGDPKTAIPKYFFIFRFVPGNDHRENMSKILNYFS